MGGLIWVEINFINLSQRGLQIRKWGYNSHPLVRAETEIGQRDQGLEINLKELKKRLAKGRL